MATPQQFNFPPHHGAYRGSAGSENGVSSTRSQYRPPIFVDPILVIAVVALVLFSLVMLYSTTGIVSQEKMGDRLFYVKRQGIGAIIGFILLIISSKIPISFIKKISPYLIVPVFALLVLTLLPGLGDSAGGAQRWVKMGPIRFQPGEFVKLMFIVFIAGYWARHETRVREFVSGLFKPLLICGLAGILFLLQPDFGSTSIVVIVTLAMALAVGTRLSFLALGFGVVGVLGALLVIVSPYRMARIMSFLSPFADASGRGYQLIQSLIAVGSGQLFGVGLGGSQQKLFFLPAAHTDFIYAVVSEELGFIGALAVLATFLMVGWRGLKIAKRVSDDTFSFLLAVGLTLLVVVPALLNMGVVTGLLPTKGLVLPLVGYGSSSLIASLLGIGVLLSIAREAAPKRVD